MRLASRSTSRARVCGGRLRALDITTDLGVPTVAAPTENPQDGRFSIGFGSRPDGRIAVQRALTEVNPLFDVEAEGRCVISGRVLVHDGFTRCQWILGSAPGHAAKPS